VLHPVLFAHCQHVDCAFVHGIHDQLARLSRFKKGQTIAIEGTP
jgi:hypothetical protein